MFHFTPKQFGRERGVSLWKSRRRLNVRNREKIGPSSDLVQKGSGAKKN